MSSGPRNARYSLSRRGAGPAQGHKDHLGGGNEGLMIGEIERADLLSGHRRLGQGIDKRLADVGNPGDFFGVGGNG